MASEVTITIKYSDNSKSLKETWGCADTHPSPEIIKNLEETMREKWEAMGGSVRNTTIHTSIKQA